MKDNLFELLLNLFENSLAQLQESTTSSDLNQTEQVSDNEILAIDETPLRVQPSKVTSMRVFTYEEQMKLTKASYQFLMRMKLWDIINNDVFELVIHQLQFSDSHVVTLQETKWTIRNILETSLNEEQLAFLDLVLYQTEDAIAIH